MSAEGLEVIGNLALMAIRDKGWEPSQVGGLTLGADPVAYAVARSSREHPPTVDAFTVRKEPKAHGTSQVIEGCFTPGARTVIVEDVLTTGASALRAAAAVRAAGGVLDGVVVIVDREEGGAEALATEGLDLLCLTSIRDLGVDLTPP
jgi:orotate phosphoribosyltransferase